jgi:hypothetical protein
MRRGTSPFCVIADSDDHDVEEDEDDEVRVKPVLVWTSQIPHAWALVSLRFPR